MTSRFTKPILASLLAIILFCAGAQAADLYEIEIKNALAARDYKAIQKLIDKGSTAIDEVVKGLLVSVLHTMSSDPAFAEKNIELAGKHAEEITPPSVPTVCADLRRIADAFPADQIGEPLYDAVLAAAQNFANAPVVVAAGRPNLCEEAWLQIAALAGDPLLAQTNTHRDPPNIHPVPPPIDPPKPISAD